MSSVSPEPFARVHVLVEVRRGSRIKRRPDGRLQYVSPFASPFDYGHLPGFPAAPDGDPQDALVLGSSRDPGTRLQAYVVGHVDVLDAGVEDPKWVLRSLPGAASPAERAAVQRFFERYARYKTLLARLRGRPGATVRGITWFEPPSAEAGSEPEG